MSASKVRVHEKVFVIPGVDLAPCPRDDRLGVLGQVRERARGRSALAEDAVAAEEGDGAAGGEDGGGVGAGEHPAVQLLELEARLEERGVVRVQRRRHLDVDQAPELLVEHNNNNTTHNNNNNKSS